MVVNYKTEFPWGEPTFFMEKITTANIIYKMIDVRPSLEMFPHYKPKIHTIREDAKDLWIRNMHPDGVGTLLKIHHTYHRRTKKQKCFLVTDCTGTQLFEMKYLIRNGPDVEYYGNAPDMNAVDFDDPEDVMRYRRALDRYRTMYLKKNPAHFDVVVYVDDIALTPEECELLAVNDGFKDFTQFKRWFKDDFTGKIIHWTDFRYGSKERELQARTYHNSAGINMLSAGDIENLSKLIPYVEKKDE